MTEQRIAELEKQLQAERNEHDQREYQVNSLHVDNVELRRQLKIEQQLTHEAHVKAAVLDNWLSSISKAMRGMVGAPPAIVHELQNTIEQVIAEYDAGIILGVPELTEELEGAHGTGRVGVQQ